MIDLKKELGKLGAPDWIFKNLALTAIAGSRLYGTNKDNSDFDIRGVTIAPVEYWVGAEAFNQIEFKVDNYDVVIFDARKFLKMCWDGAPNTIELLFCGDQADWMSGKEPDYRIKHYGRLLLSQNVYDGIAGFSNAQMKKMIGKYNNKTGRQDLVQEFGMDVKFLSHSFRLLYQGIELMSTGKITFPLPQAELLKDIRYGRKYSADKMDDAVKDWEDLFTTFRKTKETPALPKSVSKDILSEFMIEMFNDNVARAE